MKVIHLFIIILFSSCNFGDSSLFNKKELNRFPSGQMESKLITRKPTVALQIKQATLVKALDEIAEKSNLIKSIDRFEMDPVTRIINIKMTLDYPMDSLYNVLKVPKGNRIILPTNSTFFCYVAFYLFDKNISVALFF